MLELKERGKVSILAKFAKRLGISLIILTACHVAHADYFKSPMLIIDY